jgi:hypothetical protein
MIFTGLDFGDFKGESRPTSRSKEPNKESVDISDPVVERKVTSSPPLLEGIEGRVRFSETQGEITGFSDDENSLVKGDSMAINTPELSARRPTSGSKSPTKQKREKSGSSSRKSSQAQPQPPRPQQQGSKNRLPSIIGLNEDKPKVPVDTMKALQGTEYRPKSPKYMVNIERSFSNC